MMDQSDIFPIRVRRLQADYEPAHLALVNWGLWSRDRAGIFPAYAKPSIWDQFKADENDAWGEEQHGTDLAIQEAPAKAERAEDDPYNELAGTILDERLHGPGGPCAAVRHLLFIAYVRRDIHEAQYLRAAGTGQDGFLEGLEAGLRFVGRFV